MEDSRRNQLELQRAQEIWVLPVTVISIAGLFFYSNRQQEELCSQIQGQLGVCIAKEKEDIVLGKGGAPKKYFSVPTYVLKWLLPQSLLL